MALRNQPYLPLYVDDFSNDEKLNECSAESCGVFIKIMCLMHKSDEYGIILLKQKDKQNSSICHDFACKLVKHLPYTMEVIHRSLTELIAEGCLILEGDKLLQKRMVKDNMISEKRAIAGSRGGFATHFAKANSQANSVNENGNGNKKKRRDDGREALDKMDQWEKDMKEGVPGGT